MRDTLWLTRRRGDVFWLVGADEFRPLRDVLRSRGCKERNVRALKGRHTLPLGHRPGVYPALGDQP